MIHQSSVGGRHPIMLLPCRFRTFRAVSAARVLSSFRDGVRQLAISKVSVGAYGSWDDRPRSALDGRRGERTLQESDDEGTEGVDCSEKTPRGIFTLEKGIGLTHQLIATATAESYQSQASTMSRAVSSKPVSSLYVLWSPVKGSPDQ